MLIDAEREASYLFCSRLKAGEAMFYWESSMEGLRKWHVPNDIFLPEMTTCTCEVGQRVEEERKGGRREEFRSELRSRLLPPKLGLEFASQA